MFGKVVCLTRGIYMLQLCYYETVSQFTFLNILKNRLLSEIVLCNLLTIAGPSKNSDPIFLNEFLNEYDTDKEESDLDPA